MEDIKLHFMGIDSLYLTLAGADLSGWYHVYNSELPEDITFKQLKEGYHMTLILISHNLGIVAELADRLAVMYAGKIVEEASTETIFAEPLHPYTQFLINSLPKFGDKSMRDSVPGSPPALSDLPSGCPFHPRCPHVKDICRQEMPDFSQLDENHRVACWLVGEESHG